MSREGLSGEIGEGVGVCYAVIADLQAAEGGEVGAGV